jgi:hypothetical protein
MEEMTPTLMKKLITNAINVPRKAARTTFENFIVLCFVGLKCKNTQKKLTFAENLYDGKMRCALRFQHGRQGTDFHASLPINK